MKTNRAVLLGVAWASVGLTAALTVLPCTGPLALLAAAHASADLDRQYNLEQVGFLRSWDNVDGVFGEFVTQTYKNFFERQSRFTVIDLAKADEVLGKSRLDFAKLLEDPQVLLRIARSMRVENVIRTRIHKEGPRYRFELEWVYAPRSEILSSDSFMLEEPKGRYADRLVTVVQTELSAGLSRLIGKLPFQGQVSGRDGKTISVNLGGTSGLRPGDELQISTLDEVKRHPLLKKIVDWKLRPIGRAVVEEVEDGMAFAQILEEEPATPIAKFHKISGREARKKPPSETEALPVTDPSGLQAEAPRSYSGPRLGWGTGGLWTGVLSRAYSETVAGGGANLSGSGFFVGAKAEGQLWLTKNWFAEGVFGYGLTSGYSQTDANGVVPVATGGGAPAATQLRLGFGYTYLPSDDLQGARAWVKLGYLSTSTSFSVDEVQRTGPTSAGGVVAGIGGDLPLRGAFSALLSLDFGLMNSVTQTGFTSGAALNSTVVDFYVGASYRLAPRMSLRAGLDVLAVGAEFSSGAALSQRVVAFTPAFQYWF